MLSYCMSLASCEACTLRISVLQCTLQQVALPDIMDILDIDILSCWQQDHLVPHSCCVGKMLLRTVTTIIKTMLTLSH